MRTGFAPPPVTFAAAGRALATAAPPGAAEQANAIASRVSADRGKSQPAAGSPPERNAQQRQYRSPLADNPKPLGFLSIVVPVYNEDEVILEFNQRLSLVRQNLSMPSEVIFVNDGSKDRTLGLLRSLRAADPTIGIIDLSRNFGKEIALTAGIERARGDAVVVIDADLQDPPELIPEFIARWRDEDVEVVYGQRASRSGESGLKKLTSYAFYRIINTLGGRFIPVDTGDFRILSRQAVEALGEIQERHRFMKGLFAWIGFRQVAIRYERDPRFAGTTKWNYWKLWNFSIEGITSFSIGPLKVASYLGLATAMIAISYAIYIITRTILYGNPVPGYPSLLVIILFLGGLQLIFLGVIGEYLGRMFNEVKQRPLYLVRRWEPSCRALSENTDDTGESQLELL
jgi:polyisoprenyl-phosphate glycosyltransferase